MKLHLLAGAAALALSSAANAQDAAAKSPFAGPYVGVQAGVGQVDDRSDDLDYWYDQIGGLENSDRGGQFGLRVGYDAVLGKALVGALAEGSIGKLNAFGEASSGGSGSPNHYAIGTRVSRLGSVRAKLGLTDGRLAAFATGGLAFSNGKHRFRETDGSGEVFDGKADRTGYVLGLGMAYALNNRMNIGLDYSHYEFGSKTNQVLESDGTPTDYFFKQDYKARSLMLSLNYGFGRPNGAAANAAPAPFGGPYAGIQGSIGQVDDVHVDEDYWYTNTSGSITSDRGALVGLRAGYDFLSGNLLAGVMAEASFGKIDTHQETSANPSDPQYAIGTKVKFLGSVRGKLGIAQGKLAAFVTGGLARSDAKQRFGDTDGSNEFFRGKGDRTGYVLGLGAAWAIGKSTVGLDYSHYEFGAKRHEVMYDVGDPSGYFFKQDYKVRVLTMSFNYGF
jgi:opacity protein-like surface antigen